MAGAVDRVAKTPLFLACTRPAMVAGAPMEAVGLNLVVTASVFLLAGSPAWLSVGVALHFVFRAVCKRDPFAFRVLWLFLQAHLGRSRRPFGGPSFASLSVRRDYSLREVLRG